MAGGRYVNFQRTRFVFLGRCGGPLDSSSYFVSMIPPCMDRTLYHPESNSECRLLVIWIRRLRPTAQHQSNHPCPIKTASPHTSASGIRSPLRNRPSSTANSRIAIRPTPAPTARFGAFRHIAMRRVGRCFSAAVARYRQTTSRATEQRTRPSSVEVGDPTGL